VVKCESTYIYLEFMSYSWHLVRWCTSKWEGWCVYHSNWVTWVVWFVCFSFVCTYTYFIRYGVCGMCRVCLLVNLRPVCASFNLSVTVCRSPVGGTLWYGWLVQCRMDSFQIKNSNIKKRRFYWCRSKITRYPEFTFRNRKLVLGDSLM